MSVHAKTWPTAYAFLPFLSSLSFLCKAARDIQLQTWQVLPWVPAGMGKGGSCPPEM